MENLRLKREVSALEKKNKELLKLNHDLMTKNNSLNQEILYFKYSNKESNYKQPTNANNYTIIELNKTISELKQKINQITQEKNDLLKNNTYSKTSSNNLYHTEKPKQSKYLTGSFGINNNNNNLSEMKKLNENLNRNVINLENERNKNKKIIQELKEENNEIHQQLYQIKKENEILNKKINEINKIKEEYKDKYSKISKELNDERDLNAFNESKIKKLEIKLEEHNINEFDEQKTKTYKMNKINKVNEIEMEKLTKKFSHSPYYGKNTSTFSTNNTTNKIIYINNLEELEVTPDNYTIVKQFKLSNNLKWYLLKRVKKQNSGQKEDNSPSPKQLYKQPSRRFKYIKQSSKSISNNIYNDDSYSDFIWKSNKNGKDFINFKIDIIDNNEENGDSLSKQKKINELESCVKELEEKLEKKENDCNRINLNYAKLFKRTKMPEISHDKLLENIDKLKEENKKLNKKIDDLKLNQNFIGFSFIEDDLEGSRFIDDKCFEEILDELNTNNNDNNNKRKTNFDMMKYFRSHEDDKNTTQRDSRGIKEAYSEKKYFIQKKENNNRANKNNEEKCNTYKQNRQNDDIIQIKKKANINIKYPSGTSITKPKENNEILYDNKDINDKNNTNILLKKINSEKKEIIGNKKLEKIIKIDNDNNNCNNSKEKMQKTYRFRRAYKSNTNKKIENTYNIDNDFNNNKNVKNDNDNKNDGIKDDKNNMKENGNIRNSKTIKLENNNQITNKNEKNEIVDESSKILNRFTRGRRFYKKKLENSKIND